MKRLVKGALVMLMASAFATHAHAAKSISSLSCQGDSVSGRVEVNYEDSETFEVTEYSPEGIPFSQSANVVSSSTAGSVLRFSLQGATNELSFNLTVSPQTKKGLISGPFGSMPLSCAVSLK